MKSDEEKRTLGEVLVILTGPHTDDSLRQLIALGKVVSIASRRVVVMEGQSAQTEQIRALPGVASVTNEALPPSALGDLDEQESLFVAAWNLRREQPPKLRKGEGLAWDAEGFEPPDMPTNR